MGSESTVAEISGGMVLLNMRNDVGKGATGGCEGPWRGVAVSRDGGATFGRIEFDEGLLDPRDIAGCQGNLLSVHNGTRLLFSNPHNAESRQDMTVLEAKSSDMGNWSALNWKVAE